MELGRERPVGGLGGRGQLEALERMPGVDVDVEGSAGDEVGEHPDPGEALHLEAGAFGERDELVGSRTGAAAGRVGPARPAGSASAASAAANRPDRARATTTACRLADEDADQPTWADRGEPGGEPLRRVVHDLEDGVDRAGRRPSRPGRPRTGRTGRPGAR